MSTAALDASGIATPPTTAVTVACVELGCHPLRGQFKCEFFPRPRLDDEERRTSTTTHKRERVPARWKVYCYGERQCKWQLNYCYNHTNLAYNLHIHCLQHDGHKMDSPFPVVTTLISASHVTEAMWDKLKFWVSKRMGGSTLREVSYQSHCSQKSVKSLCFLCQLVVNAQ